MTTRPLIVCVDDDSVMLTAITRTLRSDAYEVRPTLSASEALAWIAEHDVAVLVSDYDMPEMTGAQLAAHARRLRPETVRMLLTGKNTLETAVDGLHRGEVFRFLTKPFEPVQLRAAVTAAIERNLELRMSSSERQVRERRRALREALAAEYPDIFTVKRGIDGAYVVTDDPWRDAAALAIPLSPVLAKR